MGRGQAGLVQLPLSGARAEPAAEGPCAWAGGGLCGSRSLRPPESQRESRGRAEPIQPRGPSQVPPATLISSYPRHFFFKRLYLRLDWPRIRT